MSIRRPTDSEDRETLAMPEAKSPPDTRPTDLAVFFNKVFSSLAHFHEDGTPIAPPYLGEGGVWARPYDGGRQTLQRILGSDGSTLTDSELWWMGSDGISFPVGYARNLPSEVTSFNQLTKTGVYWFTPLITGGPDYISSGNVWVQQGSLEGKTVYYQIIYGSDATMSFRRGTRISVDVVQWGEWQADALTVAEEALEKAKQDALPLFSEIPCPTGILRPGFLFPHLDNGLLTKAAFPDAYAQLVSDLDAGSEAILIGDEAWQAQKLANGGVCPKFMLDTDAETFRIPLTPGLYAREPDPGRGLKAGDYLIDQMRPITGSINRYGNTGFVYSDTDVKGAFTRGAAFPYIIYPMDGTGYAVELKTSLLGPNYDGEDTHPVTGVLPKMMKMYGAVVEASEANIAALIEATVRKLDTERFEVSQQVMHVQDQKPGGTGGGSATANAWRTRDLNTIVKNTIPGASLASNQITLPVGIYDIFARAPSYATDAHRIAIFSTSDGESPLLRGSLGVSYRAGENQSDSILVGILNLTSKVTFEVRHYVQSNGNFGHTGTAGIPNIFTEIFIRRIS